MKWTHVFYIYLTGGIPPSRWIVNYDIDLLDGLVVGAVLGAHMPFLVRFWLQIFFAYDSTIRKSYHLNDFL